MRQLTDADGAVTDSYIYDAFGNLRDHLGNSDNRYLYAGEQYDADSGLYYLRARYYDPGSGRFLTHDPYIGNPHEPVTLHRYLYAGANPVMYGDPSGEFMSPMETLTVATIIGSVAPGIIGPYLRKNMVDNRYVTRFGLMFGKGFSGGHILYGGLMTATIWSYSNNGDVYEGNFIVAMIGAGSGFGISLASGITDFTSYQSTRIENFRGVGRISAVEAGFAPINYTVVGVVTLPDGTQFPSDGLSAAVTWKLTTYMVTAIWWLNGNVERIIP